MNVHHPPRSRTLSTGERIGASCNAAPSRDAQWGTFQPVSATAAAGASAAPRSGPHTGAFTIRSQRKRMLIIVNPSATRVSNRLTNAVVYALRDRFDVDTVMTEAKSHATDIGRQAIGAATTS